MSKRLVYRSYDWGNARVRRGLILQPCECAYDKRDFHCIESFPTSEPDSIIELIQQYAKYKTDRLFIGAQYFAHVMTPDKFNNEHLQRSICFSCKASVDTIAAYALMHDRTVDYLKKRDRKAAKVFGMALPILEYWEMVEKEAEKSGGKNA